MDIKDRTHQKEIEFTSGKETGGYEIQPVLNWYYTIFISLCQGFLKFFQIISLFYKKTIAFCFYVWYNVNRSMNIELKKFENMC